MQTTFSLFAARTSEVAIVSQSYKSEPIELDAALLAHVSGGLAPRGTWGPEAVVAEGDAPRGTW